MAEDTASAHSSYETVSRRRDQALDGGSPGQRVRLTGAQAASLRPLPQGAPPEAHVGLAGRRCLDGRQKAAPVMPKSRAAEGRPPPLSALISQQNSQAA